MSRGRGTLIIAPFTAAQVVRLNAWQRAHRAHPYTCSGQHRQHVDLVATLDGWVCPQGCGYTQPWAPAEMAVPLTAGQRLAAVIGRG